MNSTYSPQTRCCCTKCVFQEENARKDAQKSVAVIDENNTEMGLSLNQTV